jgi:ribosome biogenesis GTPase
MANATNLNAEVIATYGRHLLVRDAQGTVHRARPMGRALDIVCGDRVRCEPRGTELLVAEVLARASLLRRSSSRGTGEPIAANLTQLAVVIAPLPATDLYMLDRYLCAAECGGLSALIVINKDDLPGCTGLRESLRALTALGYRVVSANATQAIADASELRAALPGHTTILVGQSGVGKSSLTRLLTEDSHDIAIGGLMREEEGRHTTTASRLYECTGGGRIIDSPGVRDFAPAIEDLEGSALGFREVEALASHCRFQDCRHMQEPGCAVRAAVEASTMDARRYESYRRMRRLYEQLRERNQTRGRR